MGYSARRGYCLAVALRGDISSPFTAGFYASVWRLLFFDFVMMPFANVVWLALALGGQITLGWVAFLFFVGVVCPPALALAFVRWWRSRAFWLVWVGYLAFVAELALLATLLAFLLSPIYNLQRGLQL